MDKYKVNGEINSSNVQLVLQDGKMIGIIPIFEALQRAEQEDLDLVEVSSKKDGIPVCKLMDYGKLKYKNSKQKKPSHKDKVKEIRFGFQIADHDLEVKNNKVVSLLEHGRKVKYVIELRGRQMGYISQAKDKIENSLLSFEGKAKWDNVKITKGGSFCRMMTVLNPI